MVSIKFRFGKNRKYYRQEIEKFIDFVDCGTLLLTNKFLLLSYIHN